MFKGSLICTKLNIYCTTLIHTRGQWANLASMPGLHPYSFFKGILGFWMTAESQDLSLTSHPKDGAFFDSIVSPLLHWGVRTHTDHRVSPAGLPNTSSNSNLVFLGLPSRYWPAQPCLASVDNRSWAAGWYGCHHITLQTNTETLLTWFLLMGFCSSLIQGFGISMSHCQHSLEMSS